MRHWTERGTDMIFRGVIGLVAIYILEQLCILRTIPVLAGVNLGSFLLTALLGMPGFILIFAISLIYYY